ncbi:MAG: hypothetical protein JSV08_02905 [Acidobacteriota bacterium]|nr:MAG: hypothetical protein JSV08_02905 [Acidobacteriota bacterium]
MKHRVFKAILALAAVASLEAASTQVPDSHIYTLVREIALKRIAMSPTQLRFHLAQNPSEAEHYYRTWLTERLCRLYAQYHTPETAWRLALDRTFREDADRDALLEIIEVQDSSLAEALRELAKGGSLSPEAWEDLTRRYKDFFIRRSTVWDLILTDVLQNLNVKVLGFVEDRFTHLPVSRAKLQLFSKRLLFTESFANKGGFFSIDAANAIFTGRIGLGANKPGFYSPNNPFFRQALHVHGTSPYIFVAFHAMPSEGNLSGTVVDAETRLPVPGARVTLIQDEQTQYRAPKIGGVVVQEERREMIGGGLVAATTSANGRFFVLNQPAGDKTIRIEHDRYPTTIFSRVIRADETNEHWFSLHADATPVELTVQLPDGSPLAFALIRQPGSGQLVTADLQGHFLSSVVVEDSPAQLRVENRGYSPHVIDIHAGEPVQEVVRLQSLTVTVRGIVRDFYGRPIEGAVVLSYPPGKLAHTDAEGAFSIPAATTTMPRLRVGKNGYLTQTSTVNLQRHWTHKHPVVATEDILLPTEAEGGPRFEIPPAGAYFASETPRFDIAFHFFAKDSWTEGVLRVGEEEEHLELSAQGAIRHKWGPLPPGRHEATIEGTLKPIFGHEHEHETEPSAVVLRTSVPFEIGLPPFVRAMSSVLNEQGELVLRAVLDREALTPRMKETLRVFTEDKLLDYELREREDEFELEAEIPPLWFSVRLVAEDESGKLYTVFL